MLIHLCTNRNDWVCVCLGECLHISVNISSCGTDTDKQIAAHTSLGAHLQTGAGYLFSSEALSKHVCDRISLPTIPDLCI